MYPCRCADGRLRTGKLNAKLNYTNASNSKVLTFDPVDHSSLSDPFHTPDQVRTVELVGSSPTTWIGTLQLDPGIEPNVTDPVDIAFDENGRMGVFEHEI